MSIDGAARRVGASQAFTDGVLAKLAKIFGVELRPFELGKSFPSNLDNEGFQAVSRNAVREERLAQIIDALAVRVEELEARIESQTAKKAGK